MKNDEQLEELKKTAQIFNKCGYKVDSVIKIQTIKNKIIKRKNTFQNIFLFDKITLNFSDENIKKINAVTDEFKDEIKADINEDLKNPDVINAIAVEKKANANTEETCFGFGNCDESTKENCFGFEGFEECEPSTTPQLSKIIGGSNVGTEDGEGWVFFMMIIFSPLCIAFGIGAGLHYIITEGNGDSFSKRARK